MSAGSHFLGPLQHLLADRGEAAGSRQAIDKPTSSAVSSAASRRLTVAWSTFKLRAAECAALRHGQKMPDCVLLAARDDDHVAGRTGPASAVVPSARSALCRHA
jgi:hypothetical protein